MDFGDGVTDCAIIRDGKVLLSMAERVGCGDLRRTVLNFYKASTGIDISEEEAERVLREVGLSSSGEVFCRGSVDGKAIECPLSVETLNAELQPVLERMLAPINKLLSEIPASVGAEVIEDGIFLTGGGALLSGMASAVVRESGIDARIVADPLGAVIRGASTMLPFAATLNLWKVWGRDR